MAFNLPDLPYDYKALQPHIDARTMKIHHGKHHAGYTAKLNAAIKDTPLAKMKIEDILKDASTHGNAVRNNGGGYFNHSLFWSVMSPTGGGEPKATTKLGKAMAASFKDFEDFKTQFSTAAGTRFGSGWAWLCADKAGKLFVSSTPNQDNPLMDCAETKGTPILGLDVWEHAYYLKYQNKRPDYVQAFFNVINWAEVSKRFIKATK
ncbi:MAG: Fe-Mn family superoxide dismutase [Saprospiraceae bacterium]|jgi:Fe-Mn family superoxide dismutase